MAPLSGKCTTKLFFILLFTIFATYSFAQFAGGTGTSEDPYLIQTAAQLDSVRNYLDCSFRQIADIDLGIAPYNQGAGWVPIGEYFIPSGFFSGIYNGANQIISNLYINNNTGDCGLFGASENAAMDSISLENVNIISSSSTGGLIGHALGTTINNCHVTGNVAGYLDVGGLVGSCRNLSYVFGCSSHGLVSGYSKIGGLIGYNSQSDVSYCASYADIQSDNGDLCFGGLIGQNRESVISHCFATGNVHSGSLDFAGGLIGAQNDNSLVTCCYAAGQVNGQDDVGGLIGFSTFSQVINSYSLGRVSGNTRIGGLIGAINNNVVTSCYSKGLVTAVSEPGGLIAWNLAGNVSASYWNMETSGQSTSNGGDGRTTEEMTWPYSDNTYVGWDFSNVWEADSTSSVNNGYPYLNDIETVSIVAMPVFIPEPGTYNHPIEVYLECPSTNAIIYYTLDLSEPTEQSNLFVGQFIYIDSNATILARSFKQNWLPSEIAEGTYVITVGNDDYAMIPDTYKVFASPNPFSDIADIKFCLPKENKVSLSIYNSKGQLVRTLTDSQFSKGEHALTWDGKSDTNQQCANGIYLYNLQGNDFSLTKKLMLIK